MKTVLVTGGCGFIGSHFIRLILEGTSCRVVNLDKLTYAGDLVRLADIECNERYRFIRGDIADRSLLDDLFAEERPSAVVNFAAESHVDRSILDASPFLQTNVLGAHCLLEAARRRPVERFLQISTDEVYGDIEGQAPSSETSRLSPSSPYSASKSAADLFCVAYGRTYGLPILIVRSSNNYGPFQFAEKLIPLTIRNALRGDRLPIYGDGTQQRDWLFVEDNCKALLAILERGRIGTVYNVATAQEWTNLEVVQAVCALLARETGKDAKNYLTLIKSVTDRPGHDRRYALTTQRITHELGWHPGVSLQEGLHRTVCWYVKNQEWLERTPAEYVEYCDAVYTRQWQLGT